MDARDRLRGPLPAGYERSSTTLRPYETRPTGAAEWSGAIVLVECGSVEVGCSAGARQTFCEGDVLALSCLPLRWLKNVGSSEARLIAVRRSAVGSGND